MEMEDHCFFPRLRLFSIMWKGLPSLGPQQLKFWSQWLQCYLYPSFLIPSSDFVDPLNISKKAMFLLERIQFY